MTPPILFLDIDGVLHPADNAGFGIDNEVTGSQLFIWLPILLECLKVNPEVKVVIHSAWRWIFTPLSVLLGNLPEELKDVLWVHPITAPEIPARNQSIRDFIATHGVTKYVIIDDTPSEFPACTEGLIVCRPRSGLSEPRTRQALTKALSEL